MVLTLLPDPVVIASLDPHFFLLKARFYKQFFPGLYVGLHAPQGAHPAAPAQPGLQAGGAACGACHEGDARGLGAGQGALCRAVHRSGGALVA
eukprot:scaffold152398_cov23-Tisochrysis_lutea.AAC.1